jgi:hypothetical protein
MVHVSFSQDSAVDVSRTSQDCVETRLPDDNLSPEEFEGEITVAQMMLDRFVQIPWICLKIN